MDRDDYDAARVLDLIEVGLDQVFRRRKRRPRPPDSLDPAIEQLAEGYADEVAAERKRVRWHESASAPLNNDLIAQGLDEQATKRAR